MSPGADSEVIVALDVSGKEAAHALVSELGDDAEWLKIGLELFCAEGPAIVESLADAGYHIMLDLKLHDIPQTVARAVGQVARLGVALVTVHAAGGREMLARAASEAARGGGPRPRVLAVTLLTSMSDEDLAESGCGGCAEEVVAKRARLAARAGCDGVVASPREAAAIRRGAPEAFLIATPGVRPKGAAAGDQKRVMTPGEAKAAGADFVVVGRPITQAGDPRAALRDIRAELRG